MLQKNKDEKENINKIDQLSSRIKKLLSNFDEKRWLPAMDTSEHHVQKKVKDKK